MSALVEALLRVVHVLAAAGWFGLLAHANLITRPFLPWPETTADEAPSAAARWWMRWCAVLTTMMGMLLLDQLAKPVGWAAFARAERPLVVASVASVLLALLQWTGMPPEGDVRPRSVDRFLFFSLLVVLIIMVVVGH